jgi:hypothetical protein
MLTGSFRKWLSTVVIAGAVFTLGLGGVSTAYASGPGDHAPRITHRHHVKKHTKKHVKKGKKHTQRHHRVGKAHKAIKAARAHR